MTGYDFDARSLQAKADIDDALAHLQPQGQPRPQQFPQPRPVMPQMQANPQMPQMQVNPQMQQLMARYQQPGAPAPRPFQEGGLATSVHNPQDYHQRDVDFINTRNQHMRQMAGLPVYAIGGLAVK